MNTALTKPIQLNNINVQNEYYSKGEVCLSYFLKFVNIIYTTAFMKPMPK